MGDTSEVNLLEGTRSQVFKHVIMKEASLNFGRWSCSGLNTGNIVSLPLLKVMIHVYVDLLAFHHVELNFLASILFKRLLSVVEGHVGG